MRGTVQGVGFRWSTQHEAERLGLTGWVRNRSDRTVEVELEGDDDAVSAALAWLERGPTAARVTDVVVREIAPVGGRGFVQRPSE